MPTTWCVVRSAWATGRQRREEERKASEARTAGAIQERLERRRKARERIARRFKPVAGEHVPRDENKTYAEPNEGGFNTPIDAGAPEQRGFNRIRAMYNRPEGDDSA